MAVDTEQPVVDVIKEAQSESGIRVETMDSDEGGVEPRDINLEPEEGKQSIVDFTGDQPSFITHNQTSIYHIRLSHPSWFQILEKG